MGGECSYWACMPTKTLLRPGEALSAARQVPGAREAVTGGIDVAAAFAYRDFMVSDYSDAGQEAWALSAGLTVLRGEGGWPDRTPSRSATQLHGRPRRDRHRV